MASCCFNKRIEVLTYDKNYHEDYTLDMCFVSFFIETIWILNSYLIYLSGDKEKSGLLLSTCVKKLLISVFL